MEEKVIDLLTDEEKIEYYDIRLKMYRESEKLSLWEHNSLYREASKILLNAVEREISRRESKPS